MIGHSVCMIDSHTVKQEPVNRKPGHGHIGGKHQKNCGSLLYWGSLETRWSRLFLIYSLRLKVSVLSSWKATTAVVSGSTLTVFRHLSADVIFSLFYLGSNHDVWLLGAINFNKHGHILSVLHGTVLPLTHLIITSYGGSVRPGKHQQHQEEPIRCRPAVLISTCSWQSPEHTVRS